MKRTDHAVIGILDFGSQYTHLIARRIRDLGVFSIILSPDTPASALSGVQGIILSGGPQSVVDNAIKFDSNIFSIPVPILGLCYGHQLMGHALGGKVIPSTTREYGVAQLSHTDSPIFSGIPVRTTVWMSHGDSVKTVPECFVVIGSTDECGIAAMADHAHHRYGFQFHPEVAHTLHGIQMLKNFLFSICHVMPSWNDNEILQKTEADIRSTVGGRNVFLLVSGGVDSTVCFALLERVLGPDRVYGLHIDSGLMRYQESHRVQEMLEKQGFHNLHVVNARDKFFAVLEGVTEPEEKRTRIGETFLAVQRETLHSLHLDPEHWMLGQGTIYPDTIETGRTAHAQVIKTHHNRIPELQRLAEEGKIIEPLKDMYKDEVRRIGERIGLPKELVWRHPFPGPGLGIRVLCTEKVLNIAETDRKMVRDVFGELAHEAGIADAAIDILPVQSVGVQGDQRSYRHPAVIFDTGAIHEAGGLAPVLVNRCSAINRVVVLVGGDAGDFSKADVHPAHMTDERIELLQKIDEDVNAIIHAHGLDAAIWQFPVVLIPYGVEGKESVVLRPVVSEEAMTVQYYELSKPVLTEIVEACMKYPKISFVFYDVTNKPPGTIEWE